MRRWLHAAIALGVLTSVSGCWVQQKGDQAKLVIRSASHATEAGSAAGEIQFIVKIVKVNGQDIKRVAKQRASQLKGIAGAEQSAGSAGANGGSQPNGNGQGGGSPTTGGPAAAGASPVGDATAVLGAAAGGPKPSAQAAPLDPTKEQTSPPLGITVDLANNRAAIAGVGEGDRPLALYFGWTLFRFAPPVNANPAKDAAAKPADNKQPAPPDESEADEPDIPREWLKLDFAHIDSDKKAELPGITVFPSVPPPLLVRLLKGCLTGSVKVLGIDDVEGVRTTHYRFNFDRGKAMLGMSDKDRRTAELIFERSGYKSLVYRKAEVWLDEEGRPRRLLMRFNQSVRSDAAVVGFILTFKKLGGPVSIDAPIPDATSTVADYPQLVSTRA